MAAAKGKGSNLPTAPRKKTERLASEVKYVFKFGSPQYAIAFQTRYSSKINDADFLFKVRLYGPTSQDPIDASLTSWSFSKVANSIYTYSPAGEAGSVQTLKPLESTAPFIRAEVEPVRWRGQGASPDASIGDILATYKNRSHGTGLMAFSEVIVVSTKELISE